jgi:hypothetical protein
MKPSTDQSELRARGVVKKSCVKFAFTVVLGLACTVACTVVEYCEYYKDECDGESSSFGSGFSGGDGDSSPQFCYGNKTTGTYPVCECYPTEQDRSITEWEEVTTCGGEAGLVCFADVNTSGDVHYCACIQPACFQDSSGFCTCTNGQVAVGALDFNTATQVDSCPAPTGEHCCAWFDGSYCWCDDVYCGGGGNIEEITACNPTVVVAPSSNASSVASCTN